MKPFYPHSRFAGIVVACFILTATAFGQAPPQQWYKTMDGTGTGFDEIKFVRLDPQGNPVVTGRSRTTNGGLDVVTRKYDTAGAVLWTHSWNNPTYGFDDVVNDMVIADNGTIVLTGYSKMSSSSQDNNSVVFVVAISSSGTLAWSDTIQGSGYTSQGGFKIDRHIGHELALDGNDNIYVVCQLTGASSNNQYERMMVAKYNINGQQQWTSYNDNSTDWGYTDYGRSIGVDAQGNAYVCGVTTLVNTWMDIATWKINSDGNFGWIGTEPGPDDNTSEISDQILVDAAGNSYTFGTNSGLQYVLVKRNAAGVEEWAHLFDTVSVGVSAAYTGADKYLAFDKDGNVIVAAPMSGKIGVAKFNTAGNMLWLKLVGGTGTGNNEVYQVLCDGNNNIYLCGAVSMAGTGYFDFAAFKLDMNGNELWMVTHDGPANVNDKAHSMAIAADGGIYVGGFSNGYGSSGDYYLAKYQQSPVPLISNISDPDNPLQLSLYPNPAAETLTVTAQGIGNTPVNYTLYDLTGRVVMQGTLTNGTQRIGIGQLQNGAYYFKAGGHTAQAFKVLKQ